MSVLLDCQDQSCQTSADANGPLVSAPAPAERGMLRREGGANTPPSAQHDIHFHGCPTLPTRHYPTAAMPSTRITCPAGESGPIATELIAM